jgi:hypothetical protein
MLDFQQLFLRMSFSDTVLIFFKLLDKPVNEAGA